MRGVEKIKIPDDRKGIKGIKGTKKDLKKRHHKYFLNIADILGDHNVNTRKERGFIEIYSLILMSFFLLLSMQLFQEVLLHGKICSAYQKSIQEDYRVEGVLMEAKKYREKKGTVDPSERITSSFQPNYSYYFDDEKIYIEKGSLNILIANYKVYNSKVCITGVRSQSNQIYVRE